MCCSLFVAGCVLSVVRRGLFVVCCLMFIVRGLLCLRRVLSARVLCGVWFVCGLLCVVWLFRLFCVLFDVCRVLLVV